MTKQSTIAVKFPKDILEQLKTQFPNFSNPARIRLVYKNHLELIQLKQTINPMGKLIYGKTIWKRKFKGE